MARQVETWEVQYFYYSKQSNKQLNSLHCTHTSRGIFCDIRIKNNLDTEEKTTKRIRVGEGSRSFATMSGRLQINSPSVAKISRLGRPNYSLLGPRLTPPPRKGHCLLKTFLDIKMRSVTQDTRSANVNWTILLGKNRGIGRCFTITTHHFTQKNESSRKRIYIVHL